MPAKRKIQRCIQAHEISLTPDGANQHSHVLIAKRKDANPDPATQHQPENPPMSDIVKAMTALAAMNDVTKAYFLGLADDTAREGFIAKSVEEQATEAAKAKEAADKEAEAKKAKETGVPAEVQKTLDALAADNLALRETNKTLVSRFDDLDIEKRAMTEFKGFPGGIEKAVETLKAAKGLPEAAVKAIEDGMRAQIETAKRASRTFGVDTEKADHAEIATLDAVVDKAIEGKEVSKNVALTKMVGTAAFADALAAEGSMSS